MKAATYTLCAIAIMLVAQDFIPLLVPSLADGWQTPAAVERSRDLAILAVFVLALSRWTDR